MDSEVKWGLVHMSCLAHVNLTLTLPCRFLAVSFYSWRKYALSRWFAMTSIRGRIHKNLHWSLPKIFRNNHFQGPCQGKCWKSGLAPLRKSLAERDFLSAECMRSVTPAGDTRGIIKQHMENTFQYRYQDSRSIHSLTVRLEGCKTEWALEDDGGGRSAKSLLFKKPFAGSSASL